MARGLEKGRSSLAALRRLRPPTTLASLHAHLVADRNRGLVQLGSLITKYKAGTITLAEMNAQLNDPPWQAKDNALWAKIGATACIRR